MWVYNIIFVSNLIDIVLLLIILIKSDGAGCYITRRFIMSNNFDFSTITESVKKAYNNGTGTFKECAAAAGLEYIPAGKSTITKRATPTVEIDWRAYDFHAFLKACNIEIVKHERLTASGERIPAQRLKIEKVKSACEMFVTRLHDITGVQFTNDVIDNLDYNKLVELSINEAMKQDKQAEKERTAAIEKAKEERANKRAAAAIEKKSDDEKLRIAAAALGLSIEQVKAMQAQLKPAKVNK